MPRAFHLIRMAAVIVIAGAITITGRAPHAADPQPYTVSMGKTGNAALDAALDGSSELVSLRESALSGRSRWSPVPATTRPGSRPR